MFLPYCLVSSIKGARVVSMNQHLELVDILYSVSIFCAPFEFPCSCAHSLSVSITDLVTLPSTCMNLLKPTSVMNSGFGVV